MPRIARRPRIFSVFDRLHGEDVVSYLRRHFGKRMGTVVVVVREEHDTVMLALPKKGAVVGGYGKSQRDGFRRVLVLMLFEVDSCKAQILRVFDGQIYADLPEVIADALKNYTVLSGLPWRPFECGPVGIFVALHVEVAVLDQAAFREPFIAETYDFHAGLFDRLSCRHDITAHPCRERAYVIGIPNLDPHILFSEVVAYAFDDCDVIARLGRRSFEDVPVPISVSGDAEVAVLDQLNEESVVVVEVRVDRRVGYRRAVGQDRNARINVVRGDVVGAFDGELHRPLPSVPSDALEDDAIAPDLHGGSVEQFVVRSRETLDPKVRSEYELQSIAADVPPHDDLGKDHGRAGVEQNVGSR